MLLLLHVVDYRCAAQHNRGSAVYITHLHPPHLPQGPQHVTPCAVFDGGGDTVVSWSANAAFFS